MKKNRKSQQKKSKAEYDNYRNFLSKSTALPGSTIDLNSKALLGSNESFKNEEVNYNKEKFVKSPLHYVVIDWIKKNVAVAIIIPTLIIIFSWVISNQIEAKVQLARFDERIISIKEDVNRAQTSQETKEMLSSQVEKLERDLSFSNLNIHELEKKIKSLEIEVEMLK